MPFCHYSKKVYRNFATSIESQELMDDLTADVGHQEILKKFYYAEEFPKASWPVERVLRRSIQQIVDDEIDSKFNPSHWHETRYSDGTWAVLYAAESEETALQEALFHMREFYREELQKREITIHRRVVRLQVSSERCLDLVSDKGLDPKSRASLISQDRSGYRTCQALAKKWIDRGAAILRVPSARDRKGVSVPIFQQEAIRRDEGHLKYLRCLLKPDGSAEVTGIVEEEKRSYGPR